MIFQCDTRYLLINHRIRLSESVAVAELEFRSFRGVTVIFVLFLMPRTF